MIFSFESYHYVACHINVSTYEAVRQSVLGLCIMECGKYSSAIFQNKFADASALFTLLGTLDTASTRSVSMKGTLTSTPVAMLSLSV